jgi:hypothetical protein
MENDGKKKEKDFRITWRLLYGLSVVITLLSDIAYAASLRGNRQTSDALNSISLKIEKKSMSLKQKKDFKSA